MTHLIHQSVSEQIMALQSRTCSAVELTRAYLDRIHEQDTAVGAYLTVTETQALEAAEASDRRRAQGAPLSLLDGIPFAVKDNLCTAGIRTTCASKMLADYIPPYSATVMERLYGAGAVLLGKLNMDEFAMGSTTEFSAMQITRNPHDLSRVPGGSSGGAAAAMAAKEAAFTLGSDTGGSVRQPAAFCGVVGMRPTYGTVSRYGLIAFAPSLDQIGPLTATVRDNATILGRIAGADPRDATSLPHSPASFDGELGRSVKGLRIGIPSEYFADGLSEDVRATVLDALEVYRSLGAKPVKISLSSLRYALAAYYVLSSAEASSNLARFDGVRYGYRTPHYHDVEELYCRSRSEGFGPEVKRRILLGTFALSEGFCEDYYKNALRVRSLIMADFKQAFDLCDCILTPTAPTVAYRLSEERKNPTALYLGDLYSVSPALAGLPALSLPCGVGEGGLPVGMQLIGPACSEPLLYGVGYAFERETKGGGAR